MADIIVTTPRSEMVNAVREAEAAKIDGAGWYFRVLSSFPKNIDDESRIFYVEDGYVRGFCPINDMGGVVTLNGVIETCEVTNRKWSGRAIVYMRAEEWKWIKPIPMRGFQGWRYYEPPEDMEIVGSWLDEKPKT